MRGTVTIEAILVDAFTDRRFSGNPAAVVVRDRWLPEKLMAAVAAELHLSETAYCVVRPDGRYDLRWFTPEVEVDLCGHATLATAHVLGGEPCFHTRSGPLTCRREDEGWIAMALPADPPVPAPRPAGLGLVGLEWFGRGRFDAVAVVAEAEEVRRWHPDLAAVVALGTRGLVLTARGEDPGVDFVSRFFAPAVGVPEDPVTGSAHCTLAELWGERLGRRTMTGHQVSARGGVVRVRRTGPSVEVAGQAVTVGRVLLDI